MKSENNTFKTRSLGDNWKTRQFKTCIDGLEISDLGEVINIKKIGEKIMNNEELEEEKFIVINKKRFDEIGKDHPAVDQFLSALQNLNETYETTGKKMDQKYIVCNQDEPYAEKVLNIILNRTTAERWETVESWEKRTGKVYPDDVDVICVRIVI